MAFSRFFPVIDEICIFSISLGICFMTKSLGITSSFDKIKILGKMHPGFENILTKDAQNFLIGLHEKFNSKRLSLS